MEKIKLQLIALAILVLGALIFKSCSDEETILPTSTDSTIFSENAIKKSQEPPVIDTLLVVRESKLSMVNFVNDIREYYSSGMTYNDLKTALDPHTSLANITTEGNELLFTAYEYISNDVKEEDMSGLKILESLQSILQHNLDEGETRIENVNLEAGAQWLFGLNDNSPLFNGPNYKKCRWYQLGCHASNVWEWLSSPAIGGGATNGQTLVWSVTILSGLIGIGVILF